MKNKHVKVLTFTLSALGVLLAFSIINGVNASKYRKELECGYERALNGLAENICSIEIELKKSICSGSREHFSETAAKLWSLTQQGKIHISEIPVQTGSMDYVERFLAQTGDYAMSAAKKQRLDTEQCERLAELSEYASDLRLALEEFISQTGEDIRHDEWERLAFHTGNTNSSRDSIMLENANEAVSEFPSLIYDGPFSDHIFSAESALLKNSHEISSEEALNKVRKIYKDKDFSLSGESNGKIEEFIFISPDGATEIAITKKGGYISYIISHLPVGNIGIDIKTAEKRAQEFMEMIGAGNFKKIQHHIEGGSCIFSFAPEYDNITIYPDQVKVEVAMDYGTVTGFDACDYIMNHRERGTLKALKTCAEAEKRLSDMLTVNERRTVLIKSDGGDEKLCYEFLCTRWDGGEAAVLINACNLNEEDIFLITRTEDSVFAI